MTNLVAMHSLPPPPSGRQGERSLLGSQNHLPPAEAVWEGQGESQANQGEEREAQEGGGQDVEGVQMRPGAIRVGENPPV